MWVNISNKQALSFFFMFDHQLNIQTLELFELIGLSVQFQRTSSYSIESISLLNNVKKRTV